ncbi:ornithine carbamoyltransferase [Candidatus Peregrinibacteria bacterium]|nr:ornithine carbamoyltransferase [Candidatus Peregrinibacteria bacterium]
MKSLTQIFDLTAEEVFGIVRQAFVFKEKLETGVRKENLLDGRGVALVFEKPSLRTKVAFEVATTSLGGIPVFLSSGQIFASGGYEQGRESIPDIARNLERFTDLIIARVYRHETIQILAQSISKPIINALCDKHHPTQALADFMTIMWHKPAWQKMKVAFVGDGNNVATSLMQICALVGMHFSIASPPGYEIPKNECEKAIDMAKKTGVQLEFFTDPREAVKQADVVYTDTFVSMGQEEETAKRLKDFSEYQITDELLKTAKSDVIFMHCLPAHRGQEVTDEVMDGAHSVIFDQAECRLHIAKSLLAHYCRI